MLSQTGSGIKVEGVLALECDIIAYQSVKPRGYIKLPAGLKNRRGILNIKCKTDCFRLCILAAFYRHHIKLKKYPLATQLSRSRIQCLKRKQEVAANYRPIIDMVEKNKLFHFEGFTKSFDINRLHEWEKRNDCRIVVYEYDLETKNVIASKYTETTYPRFVHLLLLKRDDDYHLCLLYDVSKFFGIQGRKRAKICPHCGLRYYADSHMVKCGIINQPGLRTVNDSRRLFKFQDLHKLLPPPFKIYTAMLYYKQGAEHDVETSPFAVAGFGIVVLNSSGAMIKNIFHIGENCMPLYLDYVLELGNELHKRIKDEQLPIPKMTREEQKIFDGADTCEICWKSFSSSNPKVRHHAHHIPGFPITASCRVQPRNKATDICSTV